LETIGGGFIITLNALQDKNKRSRIAAKPREFAEVAGKVAAAVNNSWSTSNKIYNDA